MLDLAYTNKDALNKQFLKILFNEKYKYYFVSPYLDYELEIENSGWNKLQQVSKNKDGDIIGYFEVKINRGSNNADNVRIINFQNKPSVTFSKDMYTFLSSLFKIFNFNKVSWCVIIGNPAEKMYDKLVKHYGGRIVGMYEQEFKLIDRNYYDAKVYEILKYDYLNYKNNKYCQAKNNQQYCC